MKQRIRAAGLVVKEGKLLLVEHQDKKGNRWWIPPGGGLEDVDETVLDCVVREVFEETGLHVRPSRLRYIREFIDKSNDTRHLELFYEAELAGPSESAKSGLAPTLYDHMIQSVKWMGKEEMQGLAVFPEILKAGNWVSRTPDQPVYLGVSIESDDRQT